MYQQDIEELGAHYREAIDEEAQERAIRLNALCRVYEQADRVLTGDPVLVHVVPDGAAPAWSDGQSITINASEINEIDLDTLIQVNGLNYHELAHHLYTPRRGTTLMQWVLDQGYMQAMNILEDQRIETLLVARWPSIAPFLTASVVRWLGDDEEGAAGNYICVRGRRYLPVEIREGFRDLFAFPHLIPTIANIVDEYRLLAFPRDYDKAKELIERFQLEVLLPMGILPDFKGGQHGCGGRDPISKGRPEPGKAQEKDAKRAGGMGTKESTWVPKPKQPDKPRDNGESSAGNQSNTNNQDNNSTAPIPKTAQEALAIREQTMDSPAAPVAGTGHVDSLGGIPDSLNDMLDKTLEEVSNRKDVIQDVKAKQKVIVGGDGKHDDVVKKGKFDSTPVPQDAIVNYRKFARELQRLREESEPTWVRETPSGRLNVQRVIKGCEIDQAFDRWDEGDDGCDIEAVILVDRSGSMSSEQNDKRASIACWTIKRALEHINAPVTVYAFDDKAEVAYKRDEHADKTRYKFIYGNGGTHPYPSLLVAEQLLLSSRKKNKMLFIITDGVFNNEQNDDLIERISKRGVLTVMTLIMSDKEYQYYTERNAFTAESVRHKAEIFGQISNAKDLLPFAKQVVLGAIRKRRR